MMKFAHTGLITSECYIGMFKQTQVWVSERKKVEWLNCYISDVQRYSLLKKKTLLGLVFCLK